MIRTMNFNITSDQRKEFAQTVAEYFHGEAKYTMPGFRYVIDDKATVMKDGTLVIKDEAFEDVPYLLDYLGTNGFRPDEEGSTADEETQDKEATETVAEEIAVESEPENEEAAADGLAEGSYETEEEENDDDEEPEEEPEEVEEPEALQISIPDKLTDDEFERLEAVIWSKKDVIAKSLGTEGLTVKREDGKIVFDGFTAIDSDHHHAYAQFVTKLVEFAEKSQRVNRIQTPVENEKYYFRIFLVRLGMSGPEFKQARKILLENLSGNAAFKTDEKLKEHTAKWKERRKAAQDAAAETVQAEPEEETTETGDADEEAEDENAE